MDINKIGYNLSIDKTLSIIYKYRCNEISEHIKDVKYV